MNEVVDSSKMLWKWGWFEIFKGDFKYVLKEGLDDYSEKKGKKMNMDI